MPRTWTKLHKRSLTIGSLLCLIALAGAAGYWSSESLGIRALRVEAGHRFDLIAADLQGAVDRYADVPGTLALNRAVLDLLHAPHDDAAAQAANHYLAQLNERIGSVAVFVVDTNAVTRAASNWERSDSFVGERVRLPYFETARQGGQGRAYAIETTRGARLFRRPSHP